MKRLFLATLLSVCATASNAIVLTFDDIPGVQQDSFGPIGTYAGYNFSSTGSLDPNVSRLDWIDTVSPLYDSGAVSGDFTMVNIYGGTGIITAVGGRSFTFGGMWAETWDQDDPRSGVISGYQNGTLRWMSTITLGDTFSHFDGVVSNIDQLRFDLGDAFASQFFVIDNLELNGPQAAPEPESLPLLGLGLAGLVLLRRRAGHS